MSSIGLDRGKLDARLFDARRCWTSAMTTSLRATATDTGGNTVKQTIMRAYRY